MKTIQVMLVTGFLMLAVSPTAFGAGQPVAKQMPTASGPIKDKTTGMGLVAIKGGCFQMGESSGNGELDEKPVHKVCVSDFRMGKFEVTQGEWLKIMGTNPSQNVKCGLDCPVDNVSWNDAQEFIQLLNKQGKANYRLPTEAEWEYAARGGGKLERFAGSDTPNTVAWLDINSKGSIHPVGRLKANSLGLYDLSGNVVEWCDDWYGNDYYNVSPEQDPTGPTSGSTRVLRGGGYDDGLSSLRTVNRRYDEPDNNYKSYGFRLVLPSR
jgi:formylglycine-generating enzyme required for sulfatase activity